MTPGHGTHLPTRLRPPSLREGRARTTDARTGATRAYLSRLRAEPDPQVRLQRGVDLLPALVTGCDHASLTASGDGCLDTHVATDVTSRRADRLQVELDAGPFLQALRTGHSVVANDLGTETRWAGWCSTVVHELGVTSVLSVLLTGHGPPATLNLYSGTTHGLAGVDLALVHTLVAPLEVALLGVRFGAGRLGPAA